MIRRQLGQDVPRVVDATHKLHAVKRERVGAWVIRGRLLAQAVQASSHAAGFSIQARSLGPSCSVAPCRWWAVSRGTRSNSIAGPPFIDVIAKQLGIARRRNGLVMRALGAKARLDMQRNSRSDATHVLQA